MDKITNLTTQMSNQQDAALETYLAQMLAAKQPLILAYQRKEITADEYEANAGETVQETLTQMYAQDQRRILKQMADRVKAGYITEDQFQAITGQTYDPNALSPLRVLTAIKQAHNNPTIPVEEATPPAAIDATGDGN